MISKKPITASLEETRANPRAERETEGRRTMHEHDLNAVAADAALAELNASPGFTLPEPASLPSIAPEAEKPRETSKFVLGRETRIGIAVGLSVLTLVAAVLFQHSRRPKTGTGESGVQSDGQ